MPPSIPTSRKQSVPPPTAPSAASASTGRGPGGTVQVKAAFERPAGLAIVEHIGTPRDASGNVVEDRTLASAAAPAGAAPNGETRHDMYVQGSRGRSFSGDVAQNITLRKAEVPPLNPPNGEAYHDMYFKGSGTNPFIDTEDDHLSTFAMDVDTGSYSVTRRYLTDGYLPPAEAVRVEEFVNSHLITIMIRRRIAHLPSTSTVRHQNSVKGSDFNSCVSGYKGA